MDLNIARSVMTIVVFAVFIGIVIWAWSGKRRDAFDAAARLPFDDDTGSQGVKEGRERGGAQ